MQFDSRPVCHDNGELPICLLPFRPTAIHGEVLTCGNGNKGPVRGRDSKQQHTTNFRVSLVSSLFSVSIEKARERISSRWLTPDRLGYPVVLFWIQDGFMAGDWGQTCLVRTSHRNLLH